MESKGQAEEVSDGNEELIGNWSKGHSCYVLAKRLAAFCPCPRVLWNFELGKYDLKLEVMFKREEEYKSLENLQPDNVIEKRNLFSGEKYKLAAEIYISNKDPNIIYQAHGENVSRDVRDLESNLSHHRPRGLGEKKNGLMGWARGPRPHC